MKMSLRLSFVILVMNLVVAMIQSPVHASIFTTSSVTDNFDWTGASWYQNAGLTDANLNRVIWAGGRFVAVGDGGVILTSEDGIKWFKPTSNTLWNLKGIAYNGSTYVVVGDHSTVLVSTDAVTWEKIQGDLGTFNLKDVTWGLGKFVAVGGEVAGGGEVLESQDGIHWNAVTTSYAFDAVIANGSMFVAVGGNARIAWIIKSTDGVTWDDVVQGYWNTDRFHDVVWDGNRFRAVGGGYDQLMYRISEDGITWTDVINTWPDPKLVTVDGLDAWEWIIGSDFNNSMFAFSKIKWTGQQYLAIGGPLSWSDDGPKQISLLTSSDGLSWSSLFWHDRGFLTKSQWEQLDLPVESLNWINDLAWSDSRLVIVSQHGQIITSVANNDGDAQLIDLKVNGTSIAGFDASVLGYKIGVTRGTTSAPVVTAQAANLNSIVTVTSATRIPGITTVEVTNGNAKLTYHLRFAVTSDLNLEWQQSLGGTGNDEAYSIRQTTDGGFIIAGDTSSNNGDVSGGHPGTYSYYTDAWIVKVNPQGELEWQRCLGGSGQDMARSVIQTENGSFIVTGYTNSTDGDFSANLGDFDAWIAKLDSDGNKVWLTSLGSVGWDQFNMIQPTSDGGFVAAGQTKYSGKTSGWLVKFSPQGDIEWQRYMSSQYPESKWVNTVYQTVDGGYIVGGSYNLGLVKLDAAGNMEWQKMVGDEFLRVEQTVDGGYIVSTYGIIFKLGAQGNIEWQKVFILNSEAASIADVTKTRDGGYIVTGTTPYQDNSSYDYWIAKLDSTGVIEGMKHYGGTSEERAKDVYVTGDGGYIVAGWTRSNDGDVTGSHGNSDFWLVKIQPDPMVFSAANEIVAFTVAQQSEAPVIDPASHTVTVGVPPGTDLSSLVPSITVSNGASILPAAGVAQDFTNPVTYVVTAENGEQQSWTVNVYLSIPGDCNNDGTVNLYDLVMVALAFGGSQGSPNWDARADLTDDGKVEAADLAALLQHYAW